MAKTGVITSPSGDDANMRTLGDPSPATSTLASVIRAALALAAALKGVVINFLTGKAVVVPTAYADPGTGDLWGHFVKDDASKASSSWTWVPGGEADAGVTAQMEALVESRKPSMSVESLTNAVEDAQANPIGYLATEELGAILHYDQADGLVHVVGADAAAVEAYDPADQYVENAAFVRTVAAAGSTQFGE